jgi:hypothetical protein
MLPELLRTFRKFLWELSSACSRFVWLSSEVPDLHPWKVGWFDCWHFSKKKKISKLLLATTVLKLNQSWA